MFFPGGRPIQSIGGMMKALNFLLDFIQSSERFPIIQPIGGAAKSQITELFLDPTNSPLMPGPKSIL